MQVTIGGNRVGSGKKMQAHLHNYNRSTHNLSEIFASSMGAGILYPAMCKLAMRGDSFDVKIDADARTIPTEGPLFGSFKMQVDVYQIPVRLYTGLLHNNPLALGLKMNQVKFPKLNITSAPTEGDNVEFDTSSLMHYLGMSGLGRRETSQDETIQRNILAIPALAYYDIFKTYYSNKQEEKAQMISAVTKGNDIGTREDAWSDVLNGESTENQWNSSTQENNTTTLPGGTFKIELPVAYLDKMIEKDFHSNYDVYTLVLMNTDSGDEPDFSMKWSEIYEKLKEHDENTSVPTRNSETTSFSVPFVKAISAKYYGNKRITPTEEQLANDVLTIVFDTNKLYSYASTNNYDKFYVNVENNNGTVNEYKKLSIVPFDLSNIDDMRYDLLSFHTLGSAYTIDNNISNLPYKALVDVDNENKTLNAYPLNGLVLKTYQNDIFNNWLNSEWIEGPNSISELTKVAIVDGAFTMDAFNFATKRYNMLNRIAVSGATYEDWQDVVYEEVKRRQIESPIFVGGMSEEIMFDEIVQTAPADGKPLGELGGRGKLIQQSKKGGKIHIKCDEACFVIAIVSLTPRIFYSQGNEFYLTEIESMDDLHKPAMDGIGFQDLIGERMAYFDTVLTENSTTPVSRSKIGKLPAWIEYMTSYNRAHGDFAKTNGFGYMILNRNFEQDEATGGIKDATTYIDPQKFNYPFAYTNLDAQNFWVEINFDIVARRLMSARLIPNV